MLLNKASSVFDHIEKIAATASKKEKEAMVKELLGVPLGMKIALAAYDRFKRYGCDDVPTKTPGLAPGANTLDEPFAWALLSGMADGTITGDRMREAVQLHVNLLDDKSSALFRRILKKDLRAGFTDGTVNRVRPGTLAEFPYMRCTLPAKSNMSLWDWLVGIFVQEKADGMFVNVNRDGEALSVTSRQGTPLPEGFAPALEALMKQFLDTNTQTHGELVIVQRQPVTLTSGVTLHKDVVLPREIGNGMLNHLADGGDLDEGYRVEFWAWDQIPRSAVVPKGKLDTGYRARFITLAKQLTRMAKDSPLKMIPTKVVKSKAEAFDYYREVLKQGKEGIVCKHPNGGWADTSSGNKDVVKLKLEVDVDLKVVSIVPGKKDTKNEGRPGSLGCESADGLLKVDVTVKNEKLRDQIEANPDDFLKRIIAVRANAIMSPSESNEFHSLFLPRMVEAAYRTDKTEADSLERVRDQFVAAVEAA